MNEDSQAGGGGHAQETASEPFPLNRVVAFLGPYVAIVSGVFAAWLIQHFPGLHLDKSSTEATISEVIVFAIGAGVTWALHHKWLSGWQQWQALVQAPAAAASSHEAAAPAPAPTADGPLAAAYDPSALATALAIPPAAAAAANAGDEGSGLGAATEGY